MHSGEGSSPAPAEKHRDIPSLDGLRAISILVVVLAHSRWLLPAAATGSLLFQAPIGNGRNGVTVFFVISGYLITNLLLRELDKTGGIALGRFYFRRSMRIFPAFYLYLLVIGILLLRHLLPPMGLEGFLTSATYTWCYDPHASGYFLTHTWSLSIEEQFYLFWPALLLFTFRRGQAIPAALAFVAGVPLLRLALYFLAPDLRGHEYYMIHGWLDVMMVGCLLALLNRPGHTFLEWKRRWLTAPVAIAMAIVAFGINPVLLEKLPKPFGGFYGLAIYQFIEAVSVAGLMLFVVEQPLSAGGRLLNLVWLRRIGVLSYSLYLWQQLFLAEGLHLLPLGYLFLLLAAIASFWLVEQPFLRLRTWMERRNTVHDAHIRSNSRTA